MSIDTVEEVRRVSIQALATEFNRAVHAKRYDEARAVIEKMRLIASPKFVTLYEAMLLCREEERRNGEALRMILEGIIDHPVEEPVLWAKACAEATRLADITNETTVCDRLRVYVAHLRGEYGENIEVTRWTVGAAANLGRGLVRNKRYNAAIAVFEEMTTLILDRPTLMCWTAIAHLNLALCKAKMGAVENAKAHVIAAENRLDPYVKDFALLVKGEIALAEGNTKLAGSFGRSAYAKARDAGRSVVMAESSLLLCRVYVATNNAEAFHEAHERAIYIASNNGVLHVLDELAEVRETAPNLD